jgi:HD domain
VCGVAVVPKRDDNVRTAEVIAALCLATDLGMAFPFEHGLHRTLIAMRLADRLGVDRRTASETYYASLLSHAGCTTEAHIAAEVFGGSLTTNLNPVMYGSAREVITGVLRALPDPGSPALVRFAQTTRRLPRMAREQRPALSAACEVAGMLAERVGAPTSVPELLAQLTERWDGKGPLRRAKGEQIPLPMRIVHVASDAVFQCLLGGVEHAAHLVHERAGHAFDPDVAACCAEHASELLAIDEGGSSWDDVLAWEPSPQLPWTGKVSIGLSLRWGASPTSSRRTSPGIPSAWESWRAWLLSAAGLMQRVPRRSDGRGSSTTSAALWSTHASDRSPGRSRPTSGSRYGCTRTKPNVSSPARPSSRECARSRALITNGSTDRAITAV